MLPQMKDTVPPTKLAAPSIRFPIAFRKPTNTFTIAATAASIRPKTVANSRWNTPMTAAKRLIIDWKMLCTKDVSEDTTDGIVVMS